jgi:undecaprenyl-diphosphatase
MNLFDETIARFFASIKENGGVFFDPFFTGITHFGDYGIGFLVLGVLFLFFRATRKAGWTALLSILLGFLIANLFLKNVIVRPRPFMDPQSVYYPWWVQAGSLYENGFSFPSGHTTSAACFGVALFLNLPKRYSWSFLLFPILMAASRIYFMVHYASDVLGGFLVGSLCALASYALLQWALRYPKLKKALHV